jgi:hypothetical protein
MMPEELQRAIAVDISEVQGEAEQGTLRERLRVFGWSPMF